MEQPLMPAVRLPRDTRAEEEARLDRKRMPWGELAGVAAILGALVLLATGAIRVPSDLGLSQPPPRLNPGMIWRNAPRHPLAMALPFWLGIPLRPPNGPELTTGGRINASVPWSPAPAALDRWLQRHLLFNTTHGFFLEVGAGDGLAASPTRWFEQAASWRGLLVEGDAARYAALPANRPDAVCLHAAVCGEFAESRWARRRGRGGAVWELLPPGERRGAGWGLPAVHCTALQFVLDKFSLTAVDLLVLNAAGAELDLLRGLELRHLSIKVAVVGGGAGGERGAAIDELLAAAGLQPVVAGDGELPRGTAVYLHRSEWRRPRSAPGVTVRPWLPA